MSTHERTLTEWHTEYNNTNTMCRCTLVQWIQISRGESVLRPKRAVPSQHHDKIVCITFLWGQYKCWWWIQISRVKAFYGQSGQCLASTQIKQSAEHSSECSTSADDERRVPRGQTSFSLSFQTMGPNVLFHKLIGLLQHFRPRGQTFCSTNR